MKFSVYAIVFAFLASTATGSTILSKLEAKCGPQTKVCTAHFTDAASTPQFECTPAVDGQKVVISKDESQHGAKICGPGKFFFSPMQCAGNHFEYKKQTIEVDHTAVTTGCQPVEFPYTMACYSVEC